MRLPSLLSAASVVVGLTFNATSGEAQQPRYGAFIGSSLASIKQESGFSPETSRRIGVQGGLWMNKPINSHFGFQPEVHYTQKGVRYDGGFDDGGQGLDAEVRLSLAYLEVPLLLTANLGSQSTSSVRPFVLAGPAFAFKMDCSIGVAAEGLNIDVPCEGSELGDETTSDLGVKSFDVGAMFGGGLGFKIGTREATIGLRYTQGLVSIAKDAEGSVKNNNFSVLFGISF